MKVNEKVIKFSKKLYEHTYKYLLLLFSIGSVLGHLFLNYYSCFKKYEIETQIIGAVILSLFLLLTLHIFFHFAFGRDNKEATEDYESSESGTFVVNDRKSYLMILPIYALWIFALSKIVLILYGLYFNSITIEDLYGFPMMWFAILLLAFYYWKKFKHKALVTWDIKILSVVILLTAFQLLWSSVFLPFTKAVIEISDCIGSKIVKEKVVDNNSTISPY